MDSEKAQHRTEHKQDEWGHYTSCASKLILSVSRSRAVTAVAGAFCVLQFYHFRRNLAVSQRQKQLAISFVLGFALVALPIIQVETQKPQPNLANLAWALLGAFATYGVRYYQTRPESLADLHADAESALLTKQRPPEPGV
jgi:peptidoglycan/LPS O-acetylase OafA/YrhL